MTLDGQSMRERWLEMHESAALLTIGGPVPAEAKQSAGISKRWHSGASE